MLENLKKLRAASGVSQKTLADNIGLSQQSINKYENHNIEPDIATLIRIADYFHTSVDYLVGHTSNMSSLSYENNQISYEESAMLCRYRALPEKQKKIIQMLLEELLQQ